MNLATYQRARTIGLLWRFVKLSLLTGRMPSLVGREIFRTRAQQLPARAFEDSVVFVCDVERCLRQLEPFEQRLLAFCVFEDRSEWEAARLFRRTQGEVSKRLGRVLDLLHESFCRSGLLARPVIGVTTEAEEDE